MYQVPRQADVIHEAGRLSMSDLGLHGTDDPFQGGLCVNGKVLLSPHVGKRGLMRIS